MHTPRTHLALLYTLPAGLLYTLPAALLACAFAFPPGAQADAIVRSRAMQAGTIAEYFIEPGRVRVELEISAADVPAFPNLLPDAVYEDLGNSPRPFTERIPQFFGEDLSISADGGEPVPGRLVDIGPRERAVRDEITGEPLPRDPETEPELAVFARLEYAIPEKPRTLTLHGPRGTQQVSIGFVAYHEGVAVNDFRYLSRAQTLTLDWGDPWYSQFANRGLRRQYFAPMQVFLYVESYEVRKEVILRPLDLQRFTDLGMGLEAGEVVLPAERRGHVERAIGAFLRDRQPVTIDGAKPEPQLARVNFLERSLRTSRVVEPGLDIDLRSAVVGAIFVYPRSGLPQRASLVWDLWDDRITAIPAASVDQAGPLPDLLEPDRPELVWQNFLKNPRMPSLEVVAEPPGAAARMLSDGLPWVSIAIGALVLLSVTKLLPVPRSLAVAAIAAGLVVLGARLATRMGEDEAREIVQPLLENVYHAFDFRNEDRIYDTLAASTDGAVLESTYLETRKGLELQSQGGARAKVEQVELVELDLRDGEDDGFRARVVWNVAGSIGHWGHVHTRRNQYEAWMSIAPRDGAWKLVDLDIVREERR